MNMNIQTEKTTIHNEQQLKSKEEIINDIIDIFVNNKLTIANAKDILYVTSKKLCKQIVKSPS